jgi:hypothetical protein
MYAILQRHSSAVSTKITTAAPYQNAIIHMSPDDLASTEHASSIAIQLLNTMTERAQFLY